MKTCVERDEIACSNFVKDHNYNNQRNWGREVLCKICMVIYKWILINHKILKVATIFLGIDHRFFKHIFWMHKTSNLGNII